MLIYTVRFKEYIKKKEGNQLVINATQQKYAKSLQKVNITAIVKPVIGASNLFNRWIIEIRRFNNVAQQTDKRFLGL